jgi:PilZ domain
MAESPKGTNGGPASTPPETFEHRSGLRRVVTATVQVLEMKSGIRITTRTNDLSKGGCFINALAPLPVGARVRLFISRRNSSFESVGRVTIHKAAWAWG